MKTSAVLLIGICVGFAIATAVPLLAESGWWYDSTGTQGVVIDQGGSGFYYDSTGRQGVYQGVTPAIPFAAPKSPC